MFVPISIPPNLYENFELIAFSNMNRSFNKLIVEQQHGFRSGEFTVESIIVFTLYNLNILGYKYQVDSGRDF